MGSRLTQKPEPMGWVMEELAERGLYFVDSRTINASVAGEVAAAHGVRFAGRDVFLDHENSREFVLASLQHLEDVARRNGMAVAIGHPKEPTITALAEWIPTLAEKGIELVPASSAARVRSLKTSDPSRPDALRRTERGTY